jgi:2-C-methyl-D-erythritol 2,4-cyclodiphosphate synthase
LLPDTEKQIRVGIGTDAHAFSADSSRKLWLAGLLWDGEVGVDGHSDGDVAAHAICDALLSAANLGDLGSNFGVSDPKYAGASGSTLLSETLNKVKNAGFEIQNVAVQIVGNRPKIGPRRAEAIAALSKALAGSAVSVSATSTDGLGFTGEGKGLSAIATALMIES